MASLEQLKPFRHELRQEVGRAGDVSARLREAGDDPGRNGVTDIQDDDRNLCRCPLSSKGCRGPICHEGVDLSTDQLSGERRELIVLLFGPSELDEDVTAFHVAEITKTRSKGLYTALPTGRGCRPQ
jgi:hypothetical protein